MKLCYCHGWKNGQIEKCTTPVRCAICRTLSNTAQAIVQLTLAIARTTHRKEKA